MVQHVLSRVALLNPMLFQHFDIIYAFCYTRVKLCNTRETTQVYLYQTRESGDHCLTHCVLTGENIREADVASDLPRVTL